MKQIDNRQKQVIKTRAQRSFLGGKNPLASKGKEHLQAPEGKQSEEGAKEPHPETAVHTGPKVGRNDPCPCGSGKKYKKCCLNKKVS